VPPLKVISKAMIEKLHQFSMGGGKVIFMGEQPTLLVDGVFNLPISEMSPLIAWLGIFAFGLQLYFDFSGYSDMAIGLGKMFGFNFPENFNYPYTAKSIQEFWRKWHITLSSWFKDYVYIPLGGSRKGTLKTYFNLFVVFFLTGFWHGANWNFIIWGGIHGVFMILERLGLIKILKSVNSKIANFYVLFIFFTSLVFFRGNNFMHSMHYLKNMFYSTHKTNFQFLEFYLTKEVFLVLILGIIFSTPIHRNLKAKIENLDKNLFRYNVITRVKVCFLFLLLFIDFVYISKGSYNPFIYFKF
jgi:alginate O-acetyltransferase complex protein AlgI